MPFCSAGCAAVYTDSAFFTLSRIDPGPVSAQRIVVSAIGKPPRNSAPKKSRLANHAWLLFAAKTIELPAVSVALRWLWSAGAPTSCEVRQGREAESQGIRVRKGTGE
jgi:hypothetical protein